MSPDSDATDELTPAERQLSRHLALLDEAPGPPESLAGRIVRTARWQRAVRSPLLTIAHIAAAGLDTVRMVLGGGRP